MYAYSSLEDLFRRYLSVRIPQLAQQITKMKVLHYNALAVIQL